MRGICHSLACALLLVLGTGCGSDDKTIDLPFEDGRPLSDLSGAELTQLCLFSLDQLKSRYGSTVCAIQGLVGEAKGEGSCAELQRGCMDDLFDRASCDRAAAAQVECDVTVGQVEQCMNDTLAAVEGKLPTVTCSTSAEELRKLSEQAEMEFEPAASCDPLDRCEGLELGFSGDDVPVD